MTEEPDNRPLNESYLRAKETLRRADRSVTPASGDGRIPPGQRPVERMVAMPSIIADYPHVPKSEWKLRVFGEVASEREYDWDAVRSLPVREYEVDFHCVTHWSKLGQKFSGVPFRVFVDAVNPAETVRHVIFECADGYTTNVPYDELLEHEAFLAFRMDGEDIEDRYGGPARMVIPHLYGWKSAKHVIGIRFQAQDEPGFWETRGYHNHGDAFREERYA